MFTFIHTYTDAAWPGIQKLFRKDDGLKIMHKPDFPRGSSFNEIAQENTQLYRILQEKRCPFYVDRLQGGIGTLQALYPYDEELLQKYEALLGENFWGFQLHEWASNYRSDIMRYLEARSAHPEMDEEAFWAWVKEDPDHLLLEQYTADERRELPCPHTYEEYVQGAYALFKNRLQLTNSRLFPVDSYYMTPRLAISSGAKIYMPEVGWQIPDMRIQMAYARGMAKAAGIRWGMYYECWERTLDLPNCDGFSVPLSTREGQDEWLEDMVHTSLAPRQQPEVVWENGGSSRSLQERAWLYAYLSGASVIAEEYGVCNTFYDYKDFELSQYGHVKKNFLNWVDAHPEVGNTWTPIALVLPSELEIYEFSDGGEYVHFPYYGQTPDKEDCEALSETLTTTIQRIRKATSVIFGQTGQYGNEGHVIKNGGFPDVFDIIHADTKAEYSYYINLTGDPDWKPAGSGSVIGVEEIPEILKKVLPYQVEGPAHTVLNRMDDGWLILAMNNDGIRRLYFEEEKRLPEAAIPFTIRVNENAGILSIYDHAKGVDVVDAVRGSQCSLTLGAGDWILFKITQ